MPVHRLIRGSSDLVAPNRGGIAFGGGGGDFDGPAELPRSEVDFSMPTTDNSLTVKSSGGDHTTLQAAWDAITDRSGGYEIIIDAAYDPGPLTTDAQTGDGSDWVVIRVANAAANLPRHQRVAPADTTNMVDLKVNEDANGAGTYGPAVTVGSDTKRVRFIGCNVSVPSGQSGSHSMIDLLHTSSGTQVPEYIIVDRCVMQGRGLTANVRRAIAANGKHFGIIDSYLYDVNDSGSDSQALFIYQGEGPYTIVNSFLEAGGECFMVGGGSADSTSVIPRDIKFSRCHITRNVAWKGDANANVKNLFETKHGRRILLEDSILEHNWKDAQGGTAVVFTARDQNGTLPETFLEDVTFRNCIVRDVATLMSFSKLSGEGQDADSEDRLSIHDVLAYDLASDSEVTVAEEAQRGLGLFGAELGEIEVRNLTVIVPDTGTATTVDLASNGKSDKLTFEDNILARANFGFFSSSGEGEAALNYGWTDWTWTKNHVYDYGSTSWSGSYPSSTTAYSAISNIGFEDEANDDYRLAAGSDLKGAGTEGRDPGADVATINTKTSNVTTGDFSSNEWSS